jgi:hypothetical protein
MYAALQKLLSVSIIFIFTFEKKNMIITSIYIFVNRLCGLMVSVEDYKHRGPGFDSRALLRIFLRELGLERGPLSLVIGDTE